MHTHTLATMLIAYMLFYSRHSTSRTAIIFCRGSFCIVRKCICKKTGREYAVKIIEQTNDETIQEMVKADIAASRHLPKHSHISESARYSSETIATTYRLEYIT